MSALATKWGRLQLKALLYRNTPGEYGIILRSGKLRKYFASIGKDLRIYEGFKFRNLHRVCIGDDVVIGIDNFFQAGGGIEIGSNTILSPGVKIWTQNQILSNMKLTYREQGLEYLKVTIGESVWVGPSVFIMPGANIGDCCVITAGSVVDKGEYPSQSIISGNPAKIIGNRSNIAMDKNHLTIPGIEFDVPACNLTLTNIHK